MAQALSPTVTSVSSAIVPDVKATINSTVATIVQASTTLKELKATSIAAGTTVSPVVNSTPLITTIKSVISSTLSSNLSTASPTEMFNATVTDKAVIHGHTSFLQSILLPLTLVCLICIVVGVVLMVLRKNRLEKLRHHLMPVYNFDPSEDGEDWETELLDENLVSPPAVGGGNTSAMPLGGLKLDTGLTGGLKIKPVTATSGGFSNGNYNGIGKTNSPTPSSGLLSSKAAAGGLMNGNSRQLYTSERHQLV